MSTNLATKNIINNTTRNVYEEIININVKLNNILDSINNATKSEDINNNSEIVINEIIFCTCQLSTNLDKCSCD